MDYRGRMRENGKTPEMWDVAHALLQVAPSENFLELPNGEHKSAYIPMSAQFGRGKAHKNGISVHEDYASFMVPDWSVKNVVESAGFRTEANADLGNRLHIYGLNPSRINSNKELFLRMLLIAKTESENRQKGKRQRGRT